MRGFGVASVGVWVLCSILGCSASSDGGGAGGGGSGNGGSANSGGGGVGNIGNAGNGGGGVGNVGNNGGNGGSGNECAGVSQTANNAVLPADVIWTIDTSGSMTEETAAVRANMNAFSQMIAGAGVDIRIILIAEQFQPSPFPGFVPDEGICIDAPLGSGQCPNDPNPPMFNHLMETVGSTNSLQLMLSLYPQYKSMLRPDAMKIFVVVTDDNSAIDSQSFIDGLNTLDPTTIKPSLWKMYGIFCFTDCPSAAKPGDVYGQLVNLTGGVAGDLCLQNFQPVFQQLAQGVVASTKLDCGWTIPPPPPGETFNKNKVNVLFTPGAGNPPQTIGKVGSAAECGPNGGWYYDDETNPTLVLLCDASCTTIQGVENGIIDVQFGCDTIAVPQ